MFELLHIKLRKIGLVATFTLVTFAGWTQVFQNGIRQGIVKVKFTSTTSPMLSVQVNARTKSLTTGIASVDALVKTIPARTMYRLFPSTPRNANKLHKHGLDQWYAVEVDEAADPSAIAAQFKQLPEVMTAEVDREKILSPYQVTPYTPSASTLDVLPFNDPLLKDQWHYHNSGQLGFGTADINLFEAWKTTAGANNIIVSVHDQGIDVVHKDLRNNIWVNTAELNGLPGKDDDNNGYVDDINGYNFQKDKGSLDAEFHGTHVAGTIAAVNNNGIGVSGIAGGTGNNDGVKLMSLQIFGGLFENSYIYAADNGAVISQNSWGYSEAGVFDQSVGDAIDYFVAEAGNYPGSPMKGGLVIFAAGNSNSSDDYYPAYYSSVLSVASIGPEFIKAPYSNFGDWVEVASIGGDQSYSTKSGVLSTTPNDQYAYIQGTSMACPHVSGIAALALANRDHQLTNTELWSRLVTGVVNIDASNPDYIGKLGSGFTDAALAIRNNLHLAPIAITSLAVTGLSQEFATLSWTVPSDPDDGTPTTFHLYYATNPITDATLSAATKIDIKNEKPADDVFEYEIDNLLGLTTYYFAITATDRWGNTSLLSNLISETTNEGPSISVDEGSQSINLAIDIASGTTASHDITINNNAAGVLRWSYFQRNKYMYPSFDVTSLHYPVITNKLHGDIQMGRVKAPSLNVALRNNEPTTLSFEPVYKQYTDAATNLIGETDLSLTNSSATRFTVTESEGFNLTQIQTALKVDPDKGPVIFEVYKGETPTKANLVFAQEYAAWSKQAGWVNLILDEQLYFATGETFWVAIHVPAGNLFPLAMGYEKNSTDSKNCFMSFDLGANWIPLEEAINDKNFVWVVTAISDNAPIGEYITLNPGGGDVSPNNNVLTTLTADGSNLINGSYDANIVVASNDPNQRELRIPVHVDVSGHQPDVKHVDIADFGTVFVGESKTLQLVLDNQGLGNFNDINAAMSNPDFVLSYAPWQIAAREQVIIDVTFTPSQSGNANGTLTLTGGTHTFTIPFFGVGAETSKILITPTSQVKNNITIGNTVTADITVQNTGAFPLKYFVPGFDTNGVSDNWPTTYHRYGYQMRTNAANALNPITNAFQDISSTGIDITKDLMTDRVYRAIDMGFDFPYYDRKMNTLYVAQKGFTTFDNTVAPLNTPDLHAGSRPRGIISVLGDVFAYELQGKIFYQIQTDRVIVQYDNLIIRGFEGAYTAQIILFANGDIRLYYKQVSPIAPQLGTMTVMIEDYDKTDPIWFTTTDDIHAVADTMAIGFDYPGPAIIQSIDNGSGILTPGQSAKMHLVMDTKQLSQGLVNRFVNIISNDPSAHQSFPLVQLSVKFGGVAKPVVSIDTALFGDVFKGDNVTQAFTIKDRGTADVKVQSLKWVNSKFTIKGPQPRTIVSGLYENYSIVVPTTTLGFREDWLSINYADGTHDTIYVSANIVPAPNISVDLSTIQKSLAQGAVASVPLTITNTGAAPLEFSATGNQWLSFDTPATPSDLTYTYYKENTGGVYQWIDIRKTGTQLPFLNDKDYENTFWRKLTLPFPIEFYGVEYTKINIGDNGIISFEDNPPPLDGEGRIPTRNLSGPCVMPYWTFSGFYAKDYPIEDIGIFYQFFDDHIIITWSLFWNRFGGRGEAVSAQVIFYKNNTMKFQYLPVDADQDLTSEITSIGLQKDSTSGIMISDHLHLDYGQGLAYVLVPTKQISVAPGASVTGSINMDARNVYGGFYQQSLNITTNVPGKRSLKKPVELTVTGQGVFGAPDTVDFGTQMMAFEYGSPKPYYQDIVIKNEGNASFDITWAKTADGTQPLTMLLYVDGFDRPEWTDIAWIYSPDAWAPPTYTLLPGDVLNAKILFWPFATGDFNNDLIITTTMGDQTIHLKGSAIDPPALALDDAPIVVNINSNTETEARNVQFNNANGLSDLTYLVGVEYRRDLAQATQSQSSPTEAKSVGKQLNAVDATQAATIQPMDYLRTISHTSKTSPDKFVGNSGAATTLATKFNAGPEGFNISHVETFMRTETATSVKIEVAVRAGGTGILNSPIIARGTLEITGNGGDNTGSWQTIKLDKPTMIYPNEDFYVSVTYPFGIDHAQGCINDSPSVNDRYYYEDEGYWFNAQDITSLNKIGWLITAAEETIPAWATITSTTDGILAVGDSSNVSLSFDGTTAHRGDQFAILKFATNDPYNPLVSVPITLHLNEGPQFSGASTTIIMGEGEQVTLNFNVTDKEGNTFTVVPKQSYQGVTYELSDSRFTVTISPGYNDAGDHNYHFEGTDEFGATTSLDLSVEVLNTNQPPVYSGDNSKLLEYSAVGKLYTYDLTEYFTDPEGDAMTFSVAAVDPQVAEVYSSAAGFIVMPLKMGETALAFTVNDDQGGVHQDTLTIKIDAILAVDGAVAQDVSVFPNAVHDKASVVFSQAWSGEVAMELSDAAGQRYLNRTVSLDGKRTFELNVAHLANGLYILRLAGKNKTASVKIVKE